MVIGNCGAGKSTFAKKLSQINGLEIIHLDQHYYKPNWEDMKSEEWEELVKKLSLKPKWIMDGNYSGTMELTKKLILKRLQTKVHFTVDLNEKVKN